MSILHIDSSARLSNSNTRTVGKYLVQSLVNSVDQNCVYRDLAQKPLPPISSEDLIGVHGSGESKSDSIAMHLDVSNQLIEELKSADTLVIGSPIYNFGVPASLKHWIDAICRAGISFKYSEKGPEGLLDIKTAYIIVGSGGTPIGSDFDFASGYLKFICQFIGVSKVHIIDVSGSKRTPEEVIARGKEQVDSLVNT